MRFSAFAAALAAALTLAPPAGAYPFAPWRGGTFIPVGAHPQTGTLDPATGTLYVTSGDDGTVSVIDAAACNARTARDCRPVATVAVGGGPGGTAVTLHTLYVADGSDGTVAVVDASACNAHNLTGCSRPPATVAVGGVPIGLAADEATHTLYAGNVEDHVAVIDTAACHAGHTARCGQPAATIPAGPGPGNPVFDASTRTLYVPDSGPELDGSGNTLSVVDGRVCNATDVSGCSRVTTTVVSDSPGVALADPATHTVYVSGAGRDVSVVDGAACNGHATGGCGRTWSTTQAGFIPGGGMALDRGTLYVGNAAADTVSAIATARCSARDTSACATRWRTLATGAEPGWIALDPGTGTLYVTDFEDDDVAVLDARACGTRDTSGCRQEAPVIDTGSVNTVGVDEDVHTLYVVGDANLALVDTRHPATSVQVPFSASGVDVGVDRATHSIYVADPAGAVQVLDAATCNVARTTGCAPVATVDVGGSPAALALNPRTHTVYVSNHGESALAVIRGTHCNAADHSRCASFGAPTSAPDFWLAVDPATDTVYAGHAFVDGGPFTISVLDGSACDAGACGEVATLSADGTTGLAVDAGQHTLYAAQTNDDDLLVFDTATCRAGRLTGCGQAPITTPSGRNPVLLTADPATHTVFANDFNDATVSVITGCSATRHAGCGAIPPRVPVGDIPFNRALDTAHDTLFVGNAPDLDVSVIDAAAPCRAPVRCLR